MNKGIDRFNFFLAALETLVAKADKQKNPGLYLYQNNARTPLFMLEALTKIYAGLHNRKKFTKLKEHFKLLEDALGAIDYYDAISKNLSSNKKIPAKAMQYLQAQTREKIQRLNELLEEKKWIDNNNERILKIRKKLSEADWLDEEKETGAIEKFYKRSIDEIIDFTKSTDYHFDNMEEDVHELRRKLRWLSIYPQALRGCIQLSASKDNPKHLVKYLTKEIVGSPFNKMPDAAGNEHFVLLHKNYFLSLSWMIDALGKLKDSGLQIVAVKEAIQQTENLAESAALKQTYLLLGAKQEKMNLLLKKAADISEVYLKEHNLEYLVIGAAKKP